MKRYTVFFLDHRSYCLNSLGDSLARQGHRVVYQSSWNLHEVEAGISYFKPEILVTVGYNRRLFSGFLDFLPKLCQKHGLFHIYWATEDLINHEDWSQTFIKRAKPNLVWTVHPACVDKYKKAGIPAFYFDFAVNPALLLPKTRETKEKYDISFVGTAHLFKRTYRFESLRNLLFPLIEKKMNVALWGLDWEKNAALIKKEFGLSIPRKLLRGFLPYKHTFRVYASSKIVLGVQNAPDQVTQRTFEILGQGAFMITSRTPAITKLFKPGSEVAVSSSPAETLDLVEYYLNRPNLRFEIGQKARRKVLDNHTYQHRLNEVWPKTEQYILSFRGDA